MRNLTQEQVACDIELYFYLNSKQTEWTVPVEDAYCVMNGITQEIFEELLHEYCLGDDLHVAKKTRGEEDSKVQYKIEKFDRANLLQRTIG